MYDEYLRDFLKVKETHFDAEKEARILGCISSLDNVAQRNMILEALKTERYVDKIEWNTKKHLFAFEDCIWDLEQGKFVGPHHASRMLDIHGGRRPGSRSSYRKPEHDLFGCGVEVGTPPFPAISVESKYEVGGRDF